MIRHPIVGSGEGTEQGGSSRSWLKGFRDLFQGASGRGKDNDASRSRVVNIINERSDLRGHLCLSILG